MVVILGYVENKKYDKSLDLFEEMPFVPDESIFTIVFDACAHLSTDRAKQIGNKLVKEMSKNDRNSSYTMTSAIHMQMKFNDVKTAEKLFQQTRNKNIVTFGAMMKGI